MRDSSVVKYRKLLSNIQDFCSCAKRNLNFAWYDKRLTDFERGVIQGKHAAYNDILKKINKMIEFADVDWEQTKCREEIKNIF